MFSRIRKKFADWITHEPSAIEIMPYDFERMKAEIRPGDVLLVEGRSRVSTVIRTIIQSPWTHAALYIGRLVDIEDEELHAKVQTQTPDVKNNTRLIIEDLLEKGTVINNLNKYRNHHIRICRPIGITSNDIQQVISFTVKSVGQPYNVRHLLDLARYLLPWTVFPRRWGSSLFRTTDGEPESGICSSLIAEAFNSVQFPILPFVTTSESNTLEVYHRNPYLFTPKDFDYSPYFEIIKYPLFTPDEPLPYYKRIPWTTSGKFHQDYGILAAPIKKKKILKETIKKDENKET